MSEQEAMAAVNRSGDLGPATPGALVKTGLPGALVKVEDWRKAGIAILQAATDDATRVAVRDAALRVQQAAEVIEDRERQVAAAEVVQRCNREIGRAHGAGQARNRGGRPRKDADGENRQPGLTVSRASARNYRADAEAMSDQGFETVAEAARDAGLPLTGARSARPGASRPRAVIRAMRSASRKRSRTVSPTVHPAVLEAVGKVFTGGMVDGPIAIRGDGGEVVRLGLSERLQPTLAVATVFAPVVAERVGVPTGASRAGLGRAAADGAGPVGGRRARRDGRRRVRRRHDGAGAAAAPGPRPAGLRSRGSSGSTRRRGCCWGTPCPAGRRGWRGRGSDRRRWSKPAARRGAGRKAVSAPSVAHEDLGLSFPPGRDPNPRMDEAWRRVVRSRPNTARFCDLRRRACSIPRHRGEAPLPPGTQSNTHAPQRGGVKLDPRREHGLGERSATGCGRPC